MTGSAIAEIESLEQGHGHHSVLTAKDAFIDLMAGTAGGIACVYIGQPLDTVKVKLQAFPTYYASMGECFKQTFKKDGIRGLYAGTTPALVANIAENATLFAAYGICQKAVANVLGVPKVEALSPLANAWSGFFAAFFSTITLCPTELIKCKLQAIREVAATEGKEKPNIGPFSLTRSIIRENGVLGMFKGFTPTLVREMPGYFFFFGGYEVSRSLLTPEGKSKEELGPIQTIISGGIGGTCLWICIFPADVIKSRVQISSKKESVLEVGRTMIRQEGFSSLYCGLKPCMIRTFPATGGLFLAYEWTKKTMHSYLD